jgi:transposase
MLYANTLSQQEEENLLKLSRSSNTIIHRRARIILESAKRSAVKDIAEKVGMHPGSVRPVIGAFNECGIASIFPKPKSGRPRDFDQSVQDRIIELLRHKPEDFGIESGVWTLEDAAKVVVEQGIVDSICIESLRQVLLRAGLSWRRVKAWIAPSDPEYEKKKKHRDRAIEAALSDEDYDLEFADESWFVAHDSDGIMNPQMGSAWTPEGDTVKVPSSRKKGKTTVSVYAGMSIKSGQINYRFTNKNNTDETIEYLKMRSEQCKAKGLKRLYIVWDNASFHVSKRLKSWRREHNRCVRKCGGTLIHFVMLPSKSPWLNPIEAVFRWLKRRALLCRVHESIEVLIQTVADCINRRNSLATACEVEM